MPADPASSNVLLSPLHKFNMLLVPAVKAPPPEEILAPAERQPDSFDFLALPEEIRMCVYYLCLVSKNEISTDESHNAYLSCGQLFQQPRLF